MYPCDIDDIDQMCRNLLYTSNFELGIDFHQSLALFKVNSMFGARWDNETKNAKRFLEKKGAQVWTWYFELWSEFLQPLLVVQISPCLSTTYSTFHLKEQSHYWNYGDICNQESATSQALFRQSHFYSLVLKNSNYVLVVELWSFMFNNCNIAT